MIFRFGTPALDLALRKFRLEALAWELSFLGTFAWELGLRNIRLGTFAWELWFGIFGLGSLAWNLRILRLGNWDPEPGRPIGGRRGNPARRRAPKGRQKFELEPSR